MGSLITGPVMEKLNAILMIPKNHPSLEGHFPGHPVVPAVVLLNEIERQVKEKYPAYSLTELTQAKFMRLVLPEQKLSLHMTLNAMDERRFQLKFSLAKRTNDQEEVCAKGQCLFSMVSGES